MLPIKEAAPADIPALSELLTVLFQQESEFQPDPEAQERGLRAILEDPAVGKIFTATEEGRIIGMVSLLFTVSTALGGRVAMLEDMVVSPNARGGGIGAALLQHAIAAAWAADCLRITLLTDGGNLPAQRFYRRHGFHASSMKAMRLLRPAT